MKISDMILARDEAFRTRTAEIVRSLTKVTEAVMEFLTTTNDSQYFDGSIEWKTVAAENDKILMSGQWYYDEGTTLVVEDEVIEITADNRDLFIRMISVGIPFMVLDGGTTEDIYDFLMQVYEENGNQNTELDTDHLADYLQQLIELEPPHDEFDTSELSADQVMLMRAHKGGTC